MRLRWSVLALVTFFVYAARGEVLPSDPQLRPTLAHTTDLGEALELLPPGVRPPQQPSGTLTTRMPEDGNGPTLVEQIPTGPDEWIEVEYTIDPELDARVREVLKRKNIALGM